MFNLFSPGEPRIVYREESQTQQHGKAWNRTWLCFLFCAHANKKKEVRWILSFSFLKLLGKLWLRCLNFKWRRFHLQVWIPVFSWKNNAKLGPFPDNNTKWSLLPGWCPTPCRPGTLSACVPHLHHRYQCVYGIKHFRSLWEHHFYLVYLHSLWALGKLHGAEE